jgi:SAM-dependent methyltransferase
VLDVDAEMSRKRSDLNVREFYTSGGGDRMFSAVMLTPAVAEFLSLEERFVVEVFGALKSRHLFEVGCGYGRYLRWAEGCGVDYDGVDLVSHLVEAGRRRLSGSASTRQKLHVGSCRDVAALFDQEGLGDRKSDVVVLFPFNCFGNVAEPERVVHSLRRIRARVLISGFLTTAAATEQRRAYYCNNQFTALRDSRDARGVLFTSAEGLHSYAFDGDALEALLGAEGFKLTQRRALGPIAQAQLFEIEES